MIRSGWFAVMLIAASALAAAANGELVPGDFAYGMPIRSSAVGAAFRVPVPLEVYRNVVHEDLADLRIFNASGAVVPYEFQQPEPQPVAAPPAHALTLFPLRGDPQAALDGVRVTIQSSTAAVNVQAAGAAAKLSAINGYVVDARELRVPVLALIVHWQDGEPEFSGNLRVESSDDLGTWNLVKDEAPVVNLHAADARLVQRRIELPATKAKFWRLTWLGKSAPFALTSVAADITPERDNIESSSLFVLGTAQNEKHQEFSFDLGAQVPVTQVNIELPESNSVANIQLLSRKRPTEAWRPITQGEFYRVKNADSERRNVALLIPRNSDRYWLARLDQPNSSIGNGAPKLEATWNTEDVVFLARGSGPYMLAYGNGSAAAANTSLSSLLAGITVIPAQAGAPRFLGGAARLGLSSSGFFSKLTVLWGVLGSGVLLLAWMAYRLSRELGRVKI
jgi:Protein of unknown function (DUF3999)